jgi:hypothetical protein
MAYDTELTKSTAPGAYPTAGVAVAFAAADVAGKNYFIGTGRELVIARNTSADTPYTITIVSAADEMGRTGNITAESIAFGVTRMYGPFARSGWAQSTGHVHLEAENAAIEFAVILLP